MTLRSDHIFNTCLPNKVVFDSGTRVGCHGSIDGAACFNSAVPTTKCGCMCQCDAVMHELCGNSRDEGGVVCGRCFLADCSPAKKPGQRSVFNFSRSWLSFIYAFVDSKSIVWVALCEKCSASCCDLVYFTVSSVLLA